MVKLDDQWQAYAEELVHDGRFASVEQAVEAGLWQRQADSEPPLAPHVIAAIERGLADTDAGRVRDADKVFDRLIAKYQALARDARG